LRLAVIPARGGSKRVPRKNVRDFCGRPMIAWSISAARESGAFDRIVVSTDDDEIAETARALGAEVPFCRPAELSGDHTPTRPVVSHAIRALASQGSEAAEVCCIYATAPFLEASDILSGLRILRERPCRYVFPVTSFAFPIERALRMSEDGALRMVDAATAMTRSQDLAEAFHDAGQFYWAAADQWHKDEPILGAGACGLRVPRTRVQDIDTEEDWAVAESMFKAMRLRQ